MVFFFYSDRIGSKKKTKKRHDVKKKKVETKFQWSIQLISIQKIVPETRRFPKRPWRAAHTQKKEKGTELMMMTGKSEIR